MKPDLLAMSVAALVFLSASAQAVVKCRTADGKLYIGETPPRGCEVEKDFGNIKGDERSGSSWAPPGASDAESDASAAGAPTPLPRRKLATRRRDVGTFYIDRSGVRYGSAFALITYRNDTDDTWDAVIFDCTAMDGDYAVGKGSASLSSALRGPISPGYRTTVEAIIPLRGKRAGTVTCEMYGW